MKNETILKYLFTPVSITVMKKYDNKCWKGCGEEKSLFIAGKWEYNLI